MQTNPIFQLIIFKAAILRVYYFEVEEILPGYSQF